MTPVQTDLPCLICLSVVASGLGSYPFTCANGHTLYRGSGATFDMETGAITIPARYYEPPASEAEWIALIDRERRERAACSKRLTEVAQRDYERGVEIDRLQAALNERDAAATEEPLVVED